MEGIRTGSSFPLSINVKGVNLTSAVEIWFCLAWYLGQPAFLTKTKTGTAISVTYDGPTDTSILSLVLLDTETAPLTMDVAYTIFIDDNSPGGPWIPDGGGLGTIKVAKAVKR